jgi:hypothetical protein
MAVSFVWYTTGIVKGRGKERLSYELYRSPPLDA